MELIDFRAVIRGSTKDGRRIRRVRTLPSPSYEAAWASLGDIYADLTKGLRDPTANILPPCGWRIDGSASVGFE